LNDAVKGDRGLAEFLKSCTKYPSAEDSDFVAQVFAAMDTNGDNRVTWPEYANFVGEVLEAVEKQQALSAIMGLSSSSSDSSGGEDEPEALSVFNSMPPRLPSLSPPAGPGVRVGQWKRDVAVRKQGKLKGRGIATSMSGLRRQVVEQQGIIEKLIQQLNQAGLSPSPGPPRPPGGSSQSGTCNSPLQRGRAYTQAGVCEENLPPPENGGDASSPPTSTDVNSESTAKWARLVHELRVELRLVEERAEKSCRLMQNELQSSVEAKVLTVLFDIAHISFLVPE
jgi:hypothetical protein